MQKMAQSTVNSRFWCQFLTVEEKIHVSSSNSYTDKIIIEEEIKKKSSPAESVE